MRQRTNCIVTELDARGKAISYLLQLPVSHAMFGDVLESGRVPDLGELVYRGRKQVIEYESSEFEDVWLVKLQWQKAIANAKCNHWARVAQGRHEESEAHMFENGILSEETKAEIRAGVQETFNEINLAKEIEASMAYTKEHLAKMEELLNENPVFNANNCH